MDIEILARHVQNLHKLTMFPALQSVIQPTEVPQDMEVIEEMLRESAVLTTHRTCGTVAMLPQQVGGVADQDLRVYGTKVLRVVGASIFLLTPHANLMMTMYAVAEKTADVIQSS